jgi:hypothetical protein
LEGVGKHIGGSNSLPDVGFLSLSLSLSLSRRRRRRTVGERRTIYSRQ